jgi:hypothetical protein
VASVDGARGGDGAVDAPAHRCQNPHGSKGTRPGAAHGTLASRQS